MDPGSAPFRGFSGMTGVIQSSLRNSICKFQYLRIILSNMEFESDTEIDRLLGQRLKAARQRHGLTLDALAERSGVSRAMISRVERGESSPTAALLVRLGSGLGLSLSALLEEEIGTGPLARREGQPVWRDPASGYLRRNVSPRGTGSGFEIVEAIFATCLVDAMPTLQVMPTSSTTRRRTSAPIAAGLPHSRRTPRTSRKASSIDRGSTSGVIDSKISITWLDAARYRVKSGGTIRAVGHSLIACDTGIAARTPKRRASYEALETTERPSGAPMMRGSPFREGSCSTSTAA